MPKPTKMPRITPPTLSRAKVKGRGINITVKVAKLSRARVGYAISYLGTIQNHSLGSIKKREAGRMEDVYSCDAEVVPVLVLPMPSLKSARQRAKFENLSEGEKVERLAEAIFTFRNPTEPWKKWRKSAVAEGCIEYARAAIAVMEGRTL